MVSKWKASPFDAAITRTCEQSTSRVQVKVSNYKHNIYQNKGLHFLHAYVFENLLSQDEAAGMTSTFALYVETTPRKIMIYV